jgi:hypothetical protein
VEELLKDAGAIEIETRGVLPASGYVNLIKKELAPACPPGASKAELVLPVVVSVDSSERPAEAPDKARFGRVGLVACFPDQAVFAWMSGMIRIKMNSYTLKYDSVTSLSAISIGNAIGLDVTESGNTWTVLFPDRIARAVAEEYRQELHSTLTRNQPDSSQ